MQAHSVSKWVNEQISLLSLTIVFLGGLLAAQTAAAVEVVYVVDSGNILTYNIDPQTLNAIQVGQSVSLVDPSEFE